MKKLISIILLFSLLLVSTFAQTKHVKKAPVKTPKKTGVVTKVKDAAVRGYGWGLGREAAKETIKGAKNLGKKVLGKDKNKGSENPK